MRKTLMISMVFVLFILSTLLPFRAASVQNKASQTRGESPTQLRSLISFQQRIDNIRLKTDTPGLAVGILQKNGERAFYYSGLADQKSSTIFNADSQFRFGSISKMFVSLSVLKLVETGKLSLEDKLSTIAPELVFQNQWEADFPTRIVHLLNHSTGWDAPHFIEQIPLSDIPASTVDVLNIYPESRTARWPPGTAVAYSNTGFLVAAYLVEKISGQSYDQFVQQAFFEPLEMKDSGYFYSQTYRQNAVSIYKVERPLPYFHLNNRASGGLNGTLDDMLNFVALLTSNEVSDTLSPAVLAKFRQPAGTTIANEGVKLTWGLGNQVFHTNGTVMYGHEGSVQGMNSILVYSPEHNFGYIIAANTNGPAVMMTHRLLSGYFTHNINVAPVTPARGIPLQDKALSGWYRNVAPVSAKFGFISGIIPWRLHVNDQTAFIKPLIGGAPRTLIPDKDTSFKQSSTGLVALTPSLHPEFGEVAYYGTQTFKKVTAISALGPFIIVALWAILSLTSLLFLMIWLPRKLLKKTMSSASIMLRCSPLISLSCALLALGCAYIANNQANVFIALGQVTIFSISIFICTLAFFINSLWSLKVWFHYKNACMNRFTKWHSTVFIGVNVLMSLLMLSYGVVGLVLWG